MLTLESQQAEIEALKQFVGLDGLRAGQRQKRLDYTNQLQAVLAEARVILADKKLSDEVREASIANLLEVAQRFRRWIAQLDRELGPGEDGNRAQRRRNTRR